MGQSLTLQCEVTTVRGITSRVDIGWRQDGTTVKPWKHVTYTIIMNNLLVYRDSYSISQLNTSHDGVLYECRFIVRGSLREKVDDTVTLDLFGKCFIEIDLFSMDYINFYNDVNHC